MLRLVMLAGLMLLILIVAAASRLMPHGRTDMTKNFWTSKREDLVRHEMMVQLLCCLP
jgi:hypothetical protein